MASAKWTEAELDASVKVYLEMLSKESAGTPYKKSEYRNQLLESVLKGRTAGSFEFSHAKHLLCFTFPWSAVH
jgi:hypothetical protein